MADKTFPVGSIPKKDGLEIKASITEFRKEYYIDIREFLCNEDYEGPTKKGIRFHSENWDAFYKMIKKLDQEVKKRA